MMAKLKKLVKLHGAAQVCVWLKMKDTRSLNQWLSRGSVPTYKRDQVEEVINEYS